MAIFESADWDNFDIREGNHVYEFHTFEDNRFRPYCPGLDSGDLTLILVEGDRFLIREAGHRWRSGLGVMSYASPEYWIGYITKMKEAKGRSFHLIEKDRNVITILYSVEYGKNNQKEALRIAFGLFYSIDDDELRKEYIQKEES